VNLIESCPKFSTCSAPVCPLDDQWRSARHLRKEPTCLYLREVSKAGGEARVRALLPAELADPVVRVYREVITPQEGTPDGQGLGELRRVLETSATTGSKLDGARHLRRRSP
jgi:hypothetical protein